MTFHPQPQALFSPPATPPMAMGPLMSLVHAGRDQGGGVQGGCGEGGSHLEWNSKLQPGEFKNGQLHSMLLLTGKHRNQREEGLCKACDWKREQHLGRERGEEGGGGEEGEGGEGGEG